MERESKELSDPLFRSAVAFLVSELCASLSENVEKVKKVYFADLWRPSIAPSCQVGLNVLQQEVTGPYRLYKLE